jgi:hypothetical protein
VQSKLQFTMSITEPSDAVNTGIAKQNEGRPLALSRKIPSSVTSVVGWFVGWFVGLKHTSAKYF